MYQIKDKIKILITKLIVNYLLDRDKRLNKILTLYFKTAGKGTFIVKCGNHFLTLSGIALNS